MIMNTKAGNHRENQRSQTWFSERTNEADKTLARVTKESERTSKHITSIRNKKKDMPTTCNRSTVH